jgi:hypothetical protein
VTRTHVLRHAAAALLALMLTAPAARTDETKEPWQPKAPEGLPTGFDLDPASVGRVAQG